MAWGFLPEHLLLMMMNMNDDENTGKTLKTRKAQGATLSVTATIATAHVLPLVAQTGQSHIFACMYSVPVCMCTGIVVYRYACVPVCMCTDMRHTDHHHRHHHQYHRTPLYIDVPAPARPLACAVAAVLLPLADACPALGVLLCS